MEEEDAVDNAEVGLTVAVARLKAEFCEESAEVDEAEAEIPLVSDGVRMEVVAAVEAFPAPAEDPWVLDGVGGTMPVDVDCTYRSLSMCGSSWNFGTVSRIT